MLSLQRVSKKFGAFAALSDVDFRVEAGEIVGLLGENGAGKSTLLNIIGGAFSPTSGAILWRDQTIEMSSPRDASRLGIGVVHQHPQLVEAFSAAENLALAASNSQHASSTRSALFHARDWESRVESWANELGWNVPTDVRVEAMSVGQRQRIEILKALFARGEIAQLLLLDEPTTNLTPAEADELFGVMRRLKSEGRGLVFVSHKLREVIEICDRVVILRRGKVVGERQTSQTDADELAQLMIGDSATSAAPSKTKRDESQLRTAPTGELQSAVARKENLQIASPNATAPNAELKNAATPNAELQSADVGKRARISVSNVASASSAKTTLQTSPAKLADDATSSTRLFTENSPLGLEIKGLNCGQLRDFSLQVREGEIVGIAGVDGNGQSELAECLSGLRVFDAELFESLGEIAVIPPDRERSGLIADFSLAENVALHPRARQKFGRFARFDWRGAQTLTREMMTRFDVRAPQSGERSRARQLSGGNQQKLLIARALEFGCGVVVAADPTRGLDIGAARFVHSQLRNVAQNGAAVLLISTDLDEVLTLSNRIGVLYEGRLLPDENLLAQAFSRDEIGRLMGGKS